MNEPGSIEKRRPVAVYLAGLAIIVFVCGVTWFQWKFQPPAALREARPAAPSTPRLTPVKEVPGFELRERSGAMVHLSDLKGKVWLADFIYTTCPGPCPLISANLESLQNDALAGDDVRFVSITMDPENDTPAVLERYAERFQASPDKWLFLTGGKAAIQDLVRNGFLLALADAQVQDNQPIIHSTKIALVDKQGWIRSYYEGTDASQNQQILKDIKTLENE